MKKLLLLILFLPFTLKAQEYIDVFKIGYSNNFDVKFENTDKSTDVKTFETEITYPIILNEKYVLITGADFSRHNLQLFPDFESTTLYNALLKIGFITTYSEKWSSTIVLLPKMSSDYKNISGNDFYLGGFAVAKFKKNEYLRYIFGIYGSTEAFGFFGTPIFGIYYHSPNKRFEIEALLPISVDMNYSFGKTSVGFDYFGIGRSYNIDQKTTIPVYVEQSPLEFSSYFQLGLLDNSILLRAKVGYTNNTYEVYEQGDKLDFRLSAFSFGDDRAQLNPKMLGSAFLKFEAIYRIHFKEKSDKNKQ